MTGYICWVNNLVHSSHLQWLKVQHVKWPTGDLRSIFKSMVAGARRTETDEEGGEWRPVPLAIPGDTWAWRLPGRTDLSWTDSGRYYAVHWGTYMADWQTLGLQANGCNSFFIFTNLTTAFSLGTKKQKATTWIKLWAAHSTPVQGKESVILCFLHWLCFSCLGISWDYKQEVAPTSYSCSSISSPTISKANGPEILEKSL